MKKWEDIRLPDEILFNLPTNEDGEPLGVTRELDWTWRVALDAQAKATWEAREPEIVEARKAGIKTVVEWIEKTFSKELTLNQIMATNTWQAKSFVILSRTLNEERMIELMTPIVSEVNRGNIGVFQCVKALLDLREDCLACKGSGCSWCNELKTGIRDCPDCKGTGKGERLLLVRAENQIPPSVKQASHSRSFFGDCSSCGAEIEEGIEGQIEDAMFEAQQDMLAGDSTGIWVKVIREKK